MGDVVHVKWKSSTRHRLSAAVLLSARGMVEMVGILSFGRVCRHWHCGLPPRLMLPSDRNFLMQFLLEDSEEGVTREKEVVPAVFEAARGKISNQFSTSRTNLHLRIITTLPTRTNFPVAVDFKNGRMENRQCHQGAAQCLREPGFPDAKSRCIVD